MEFQLPFPTLQHLASLRIAVHLANEKIGPFRRFPEATWIKRSPSCLQDVKLEMIVMELRILEHLKPMLAVVVTGVFHQLCQWLAGLCRCMGSRRWEEHFVANFRQMDIVVDVHGRLDVTAIWDRFFVSKMAATTSEVEPLLELLEVAVFHQQLTHLDAILRKVMDIWDRGTELDGPNYTYSEAGKLKMRYGLKKCLSQTTSQLLCFKFHQHVDSAFVDEDSITITIFGTWLSVQSFETYLRTVGETSPSYRAFSDFAWNQTANSTREFFEGLSETDFNELLRTMVPFQCSLLEDFLIWPFAQYVFLPLLQHFRTNLLLCNDCVLFLAIVERMPSRVEFGDYYGDIFREFWKGIPGDKKYNLLDADLSSLQIKNPFLHRMVVRDIEALSEEDNELLSLERLTIA